MQSGPNRAAGIVQKSSRACENLANWPNCDAQKCIFSDFRLQQNAFDVTLGCYA
jgi:hypothetical protein